MDWAHLMFILTAGANSSPIQGLCRKCVRRGRLVAVHAQGRLIATCSRLELKPDVLLFLLGVFLTVEGVVGPGYGRTLGKFIFSKG